MRNDISYTEIDGIFYPDLRLPEQIERPLGKYAMMRLDFLKRHRRGTYTHLVCEAAITEHLYEIEQQAKEQIQVIIERLAAARGIDEALKQKDQLRWVQEMNLIKQTAEEIVISEVILK